MIASQRDTIIQGLLCQHGAVTIAEICTHCNCSKETARRDLRRLEKLGLLWRTHGGGELVSAIKPPPGNNRGGCGELEARSALLARSDVLIVTPVEIVPMRLMVERARRAHKPIIAEAVKYRGAQTVVSVDNYQAGLEAGRWLGRYAIKQGLEQLHVLHVQNLRGALANVAARSAGFADGLHETCPKGHTLLNVDGQGEYEPAYQMAADALAVHSEINAIFGINDNSTLGALAAYRAAGLDEQRLVVIPFGLEGKAAKSLLLEGGPCKMAVAMFPEVVGRACVDAAVCASHGCALPEMVLTPFALVTPETLEIYYQYDAHASNWNLLWSGIQQLSASPSFSMLNDCHNRSRPARLGYMVIWSSHEWYQNVRRAMQERCRALNIALEVFDASQDIEQEVELLKRNIAQAAAQFVREGDTIILDAGATTTYLARALRGRTGITVITNSLAVLTELGGEPGITLVATGGVVRQKSRALTGLGAEATFRDVRADMAFIGCTGVNVVFGLSNTNIAEAGVKQAMTHAAREVILLADSTKVGVESLVKFAPVTGIHRLITDANLSPQDRLAFTQQGVQVTVAEDTRPD